MRNALGELLEDLTLTRLALGIALGWALTLGALAQGLVALAVVLLAATAVERRRTRA